MSDRWVLNRKLLALLLAACVPFASHPLCAQVGTTTDLIVGRVVGPDTLPLSGAHVDVTSLESGITRTRPTDDDGRFSIVFPDGGGQYVVTVHYLGMAPIRLLVRRQADEDRLVANVRLIASPVLLSGVTVEARQAADSLAAGAGAMGALLSRELLDRLGYHGNEAAALALITPGVTLLPGADSSLSSIAIGGQAPSQTGRTVDGLQAGGATLPREAVKSTSVVTSAYDVSSGQYSGGYVEQSTVSGTNALQASVNSSMPLAPIGDLPARSGVLSQRQSGINAGGNLSGPFKKDHLFGAMAVHVGRTSIPGASVYTLNPATLGRLGVVPDSLTHFLQILDAEGMPRPTDDLAGVRDYGNRQLFGRVDFTPNESQTLTLSASDYKYWTRGWFTGPLSTPLSGGEYSDRSWRGQISLTSHFGSWVNDARASVSNEKNGASSRLSATSGTVVVPSSQTTDGTTSGISTFTFGGNPYASQLTTETTIDTKDELSWLSESGAHRAKLGVALTLGRSTGGMPANQYGTYRFNSLADLRNGVPASFTRTLAPHDRSSASADAALYIGDAWRTGPKLQLVYGVRLEHTSFADAPRFNADVSNAFGIHTNTFPQETRVSPRLGFTYFYGAGDGKPAVVTIRGGIGFFRSGASQVASLFAAARDATGLIDGQAQLNCVGASVPALDWDYFTSGFSDLPAACAGGTQATVVSALPNVTAIDPSFQVPRTLRASLNASRSFAKAWNVSIDGSFSNGYAGTAARDLNLAAAPRFTLEDEADRPVYVAPSAIVTSTGAIALSDSRVVPAFGTVSLISSSLRNEYRSLTLSLGRMSPKFSVNGSYGHTYARMQVLGSSAGNSFFGSVSSTGGDPRVAQWIRNPYAPPSQLRMFVSYRPKSWLEVTPSMFAQSGYVFEPLVAGDVNGDGSSNDRAFIFDPARTADTSVANGMSRLLASTPPRIRECLTSQLGRVARAGSCGTPMYVSGGFTAKFTPPWSGGRLSLSLQTNNAVAGLDMLLHGADHTHGWGQYSASDRTLLYVRGFDPVTQSYRYAVNERFGVPNAKQTYYRQPMQVTLVGQMTLGHMQSGGMGIGAATHAGVASGTAAGAAGTHADTLRAKIAATVPNVFRRVLALKDSLSLALDSVQVVKLRTLSDAYQPRADSLVSAIVTIMSAPVAGSDPAGVATRVRAKSDEAAAMFAHAVADLRAVLQEVQWKKLPRNVIEPAR
jgi:hypothetical protein